MNRLDKIIDDIRYTLECLTVLREIQETGDCNICKNRECTYRPSYGQLPRYNCPFYIKPESEVGEAMEFPETFEEFIDQYGFIDSEEIYTNGSQLIQVYRVKQWLEHTDKECNKKRKFHYTMK